jgi:hypothetical protein
MDFLLFTAGERRINQYRLPLFRNMCILAGEPSKNRMKGN